MAVLKYGRRQFIQTAGGYLLAIPFLPSLATKAHAQSAMPKRFVAVRTIYGQPPMFFYPGVRPTNQIEPGVYYRALGTGQVLSRLIGSEFQSISHKLSILRGIDNCRGGHNPTNMLSPGSFDWVNPPRLVSHSVPHSLDEVMARSSAIYPVTPIQRNLRIQAGSTRRFQFSLWDGVHLDYESDMQSLFTRTFGAYMGGGPPPVSKKSKVIDLVKPAYDSLIRSDKPSQVDKNRFQQYMDKLNDTQNALNRSPAGVCAPPSTLNVDTRSPSDLQYKAARDIIVLALNCGITNIISWSADWFGSQAGEGGSSFHGISHWTYNAAHRFPDQGWGAERKMFADDSSELAQRILRYFSYNSRHIGQLMTEMDGITESNGKTMLDNSLVFWGNEQAGAGHSEYSMPTVVAGTLDGKVRPGYYDYTRRPFIYRAGRIDQHQPVGTVTQTNFLNTIANLYGIPRSEYERNGRGGFGEYNVADQRYGFRPEGPYAPGIQASEIFAPYTGNPTNERKDIPGWKV